MGVMTTCTGDINDNPSSKELKFCLVDSPYSSARGKYNNNLKYKTRSNSQILSIIKEDKNNNNDFDFIKFVEEKNENQNKNQIPKMINKKKYIKNKKESNIINNNNNYNNNSDNGDGDNNNKEKIKSEDDCDIIECDDEFDCDNFMFNMIKNVDINNTKSKRVNYFYENNKQKNLNENNNLNYNKDENINISKNLNDNNIIINVINDNNNTIRKEKNSVNNELLNDSYINKDLNMELSVSKNKINGSEIQSSTIFENLINNEQSVEKNVPEIDNIYNNNINNRNSNNNNCNNNNNNDNNNNNLNYANKIEKINLDSIQINCYDNNNNNYIEKYNNNNLSENNQKKKQRISNDFKNCKIDNNINININNNLNNISGIHTNSELNNNDCIDISSNMTYFLSMEKSHRRPIATISENNINNYSTNIVYNKGKNINKGSSAGIHKYKWKLLPKNKYNTQICKSFSNNQSLSMNEENNNLKNYTIMTVGPVGQGKDLKQQISSISDIKTENDKIYELNMNNNIDYTEYKKEKEQQDKKIKTLQDKIKNLYKIINEEKEKEIKKDEKISKIEELLVTDKKKSSAKKKENVQNLKLIKNIKNENENFKKALNNIKLVESQKDNKIKKLEEQLENVKKNNKINKNLLIKKNKQIKNLIESKNKQDELIKKYELSNKFNNHSTKGVKKINYLNDIDNGTNSLLNQKTSVSVILDNNETNNILYTNNSNNNYSLTKSININNKLNKSAIKENKQKNNSNKVKKKNRKSFTETLHLEQVDFQKIHKKKDKLKHTFRNTNTKSNLGDSNNNTMNYKNRNSLKSVKDKKINYNNYCNSLCNKSKNRYSNKISLNRIKMYKFNKCQNLPKNITSQVTNKNDDKLKEKRHSLNLNSNKNSQKKIFSFKKSKKLTKENTQDLKEMYLKAGKAHKEIIDDDKKNNNSHTNLDNNISENHINKLISYNNIFYRNNQYKNNITNSNNNTTITNNITNLSMSPIILSALHNYDNLSMDEKLNLSEKRNNNINSFNQIIHYYNNDDDMEKEKEKEKNENNNIIYKKLFNEGFLRYEEICKNKCENKKEENNECLKNDVYWKLNFGMANELFEIKIKKDEFMFDVKNKFLNDFFEKKMYGKNEKKYITDNILFLNKEGIIDIQKKVNENHLNNNEIIIPVLKDVT